MEYLFVDWYIVPILAVVFWVLFRGNIGIRTFDNATFWAGIIIMGFFFMKEMWGSMKNESPKVIYPHGWDTYDPSEIYTVGNFKIVPNAIKAWSMYFRLPGANIFPLEADGKYGSSMGISAEMKPMPMESLPDNVQTALMNLGLKPPFKIGYANAEQYIEVLDDPKKISGENKPSVDYLVKLIEEQNKVISFLRDIIKGKYKDIHGIVKSSQLISGKSKSLSQSLKDLFTESGDKE